MFLKLRDICFFFEKATENNVFFNKKNYQFYSTEERDFIVYEESYEPCDFLLIPKIDQKKIIEKFLLANNNNKLLRRMDEKDFSRLFHWYLEDNQKVDVWLKFEQFVLIDFASKWCEQNSIIYTRK